MFAGRVDRSGGREGKKSLRKNKIAIKDMQKNQVGGGQATESKPAPPRLCALTPESLFDCGCALANRKFENDQLKVIERAKRSNVPVMLVMTNDFEKQEEIIKMTGEHSGHIYALVGIHPDNVKRMNEKLFAQRLAQLKTLALSPPVVGLSCGLDFSRDVGSHYAQEKLLNAQLELSAALNLPAVISQTAAGEKLVELVLQHAASLPAVGLFNFTATAESEIAAWVAINDQFPIYFILTGLVTEKNDKAALFRTLIPKIPIDRLLIASDSPFYTPQNIEDVWVREQRNEPSNLPSVVQVLSEACGLAKTELLEKLRLNAKSFFGLLEVGELTDVEETEEVLKQVSEAKELEEQVQQAEAAAAKLAIADTKKDSDGGGSDEGSAGKMRKPAAAGRKNGSPQARGKPAAASPAAPQLKGKAARRERRQRMQDLDEEEEAAEGSEGEEEDNKRGGARGNKKGQREPPRPVLAPRAKDKPAAAAAAVVSAAKKPAAKVPEKTPEVDDDEEADDAEEDEVIGNIDLGYACRMCRSVLFFTDDIVPHQFGGGVEGCQVFFLKNIPAPTTSAEGKLLCGKCGAKVGRVAKTPLICSCGSLQAADTPVHVYAKKKSTDLKSNQLTATEIAEFQEAKAGARKKRTEKKKGPAKKSTSNFSSFRNKDTK